MKSMLKKCLAVFCFLLLLPAIGCAIEKAPGDTDLSAFITKDEAIATATAHALSIDHDFSQLDLMEAKATLVYDSATTSYQWIVCHAVKEEAFPYLSTAIAAQNGEILSVSRENYYEIQRRWEEEKQLSKGLWSLEDLAFFDEIYKPDTLFLRHILPSEEDLTAERAQALALQALKTELGVTEEALANYQCISHLMLDFDGSHKWYVTYVEMLSNLDTHTRYQVTLDAATGEIILCIDNAHPGYGKAHTLRVA